MNQNEDLLDTEETHLAEQRSRLAQLSASNKLTREQRDRLNSLIQLSQNPRLDVESRNKALSTFMPQLEAAALVPKTERRDEYATANVEGREQSTAQPRVGKPVARTEVREPARERESTPAEIEAAYRAGLAQVGGYGRRNLSKSDHDLDQAFRSAILEKNPAPIMVPVDHSTRSYYRPGIEMENRTLLKTTPTQAQPVSVYDRLVEYMVESSAVMRAGATVINTDTGEDLLVPRATAMSTSAITAEAGLITASDPTLDAITLKAYKYTTYFEVSHELANDNSVDLLDYLARQAGQSLALADGNHQINGTGSGQPRGILLDAAVGKTGGVGTTTSLGAQATANQGTDLLWDLYGSLAEPYVTGTDPAWLMRNASLTAIRKLKDSAGQPIDLGSIFSRTFVDPFVPAMAVNAKSIIFGDFSRYFIRIAEGVRFERSDDYKFQNDLVAFKAAIRLDAALVDPNAIKVFQNSAT